MTALAAATASASKRGSVPSRGLLSRSPMDNRRVPAGAMGKKGAGSKASPRRPASRTAHAKCASFQLVEGKGFVERDPKLLEHLRDAIVRNAAKRGRPHPPASHQQ